MAESNLQRKLAYLNTLYEIYQEQGIRVAGSQMTNTEYAQFAYLKYLLFLANQDRIITEEEVTYCNVCLQKNLTRPAVERFLAQYTISFSGVTDALLALLSVTIRADLAGNHADGSVSLLLIETVEQMGTQFSAPEESTHAQQMILLHSLLQQLYHYRSAAIQEWHDVKKNCAARVPADFVEQEDIPLIPVEKEPELTEASVEDAPTETLEELMEQLHQLTGLQAVKKELDGLINLLADAADFSAHGLFRQSRYRKDYRGTPACENLRTSWRFEKGAFGGSRSFVSCQRLCRADGNQDQKGAGSCAGRRSVH